MRTRCAVLDDYQRIALTFAAWSTLDGRVDVVAFDEHFAATDDLVAAISDYAVVVAMRERTAFTAERFAPDTGTLRGARRRARPVEGGAARVE
jgi:hypothetical protein